MDTNRANEIITEIIQNALVGQLDPSSNVNPKFIAEAIAAKVNFEKTYNGSKSDKIVGTLIDIIVSYRKEMEHTIDNLKEDEKFLANFIRGKITAYNEILKALKTL